MCVKKIVGGGWSREHYPWLTLQLDPGNRRPLTPSAVLVRSAYHSHSGSCFQGNGLERVRCWWDHPVSVRDWTQLRLLHKLLRFWQSGCPGKPCKLLPLLIKPAAYQSEVVCLFLRSLLALGVRGLDCERTKFRSKYRIDQWVLMWQSRKHLLIGFSASILQLTTEKLQSVEFWCSFQE